MLTVSVKNVTPAVLTNRLLTALFVLHLMTVIVLTVVAGCIYHEVKSIDNLSPKALNEMAGNVGVATRNGARTSERVLPLMQDVGDIMHVAHQILVPAPARTKPRVAPATDGAAVGTVDGAADAADAAVAVGDDKRFAVREGVSFGGIDFSGIVEKLNDFDMQLVTDAIHGVLDFPLQSEIIPLAKRALSDIENMERLSWILVEGISSSHTSLLAAQAEGGADAVEGNTEKPE